MPIIILALLLASNSLVDYALAASGDLDTTYGNGGRVTTDFFGGSDSGHAIAIQSDGKIIVSGRAFNQTSGSGFGLARYNADGSPDQTFEGGGKLTTDFGPSLD